MLTAVLRQLAVRAGQLPTFQGLARNENGGTAVEFGLVAAPFIALLVALFQTALVFLAGRELDQATAAASRYVLTGQAQNSSMTPAQFTSWVCGYLSALFSCSNLMVNVQTYSSFSAVSTSAPTLTYNAQGQVTNTWTYAPGGPGEIVVVQVMYQWPVVLGPLSFNLSNLANGDRLLMSTAVFQNEPYQSGQ
jgi:Flp pilus assembly protein TadG